MEQHEGLFDGLPDAPSKRYANQQPEGRSLGVETAFADTEGAACGCSRCQLKLDLLRFDLFLSHVPFGVDRPYEQVGDEAEHEHAGEDVEDRSIEFVGCDALCQA